MRIPINWLKEYVDLPGKIDDLTNQLTMAGHMLDKSDKVNGNQVIDLELRGNRADCYSILGIAREVSALFQTPVRLPISHKILTEVEQLKNIKLDVTSKYLQRVMMVTIKDIKLTESPKWLKERLIEYGIPSLNNIVDLSNYVMIETGQPLHTFDLDKVGTKLAIRLAKSGEQLTTFQGEKIELTDDDLVWANEKSILSVAGAIGSKFHSISNDTKNVLLEGASYNQANIRRTIHKHNLLTDAGIRHEKELDPNLVEVGIYRFLQLIKENKWGNIAREILNYYPKPVKPWKIKFNLDYLDHLSGTIIERKKIKEILKWLNFETVEVGNNLEVTCPTYRTDVTQEEDLVEEILRINGYDKIPRSVLSLEIPKDITPDYINQEIQLKNHMIHLGFDEIISLPFIPAASQKDNVLLTEKASPVVVVNRPSPDLEEMQMTTYPNMINSVKKIINERGEEARLFEVGKIYYQKNNKQNERRVLGLCYWKKTENNYLKFKGFLEALFQLIRIKNVNYSPTDSQSIFNFSHIKSGGALIGTGGLKDNIFFTEIYLDVILNKSEKRKAELWPKYPPQIEDITLVIPEKTKIGEVLSSIKSVDSSVNDVELEAIYKNSYTFRVHYQDPKKTLTDAEVKIIRDKILREVSKKFGVVQKE